MDHNTMSCQAINAQCCCFNLRKITRAVTQFFDRHLEPAGIRATQFTLLITLSSTSTPKTLTEMASGLVMDRTTLTRNLRPLEKAGFISGVKLQDKRTKAYVLTDKGREALDKGFPLWQKAQDQIVGQMTNDRYARLLNELGALRIAATLPKTRKQEPKQAGAQGEVAAS